MERPLYLRERLNRSYTTGAYFWGKNLAEFPFHILFATIFVAIAYFGIGLNTDETYKFFVNLLIMNIGYFAGVSYAMCLSVFIPNYELAMALVPVTLIPQILFSGFLVNAEEIPVYFKEFEYISVMRYTL